MQLCQINPLLCLHNSHIDFNGYYHGTRDGKEAAQFTTVLLSLPRLQWWRLDRDRNTRYNLMDVFTWYDRDPLNWKTLLGGHVGWVLPLARDQPPLVPGGFCIFRPFCDGLWHKTQLKGTEVPNMNYPGPDWNNFFNSFEVITLEY